MNPLSQTATFTTEQVTLSFQGDGAPIQKVRGKRYTFNRFTVDVFAPVLLEGKQLKRLYRIDGQITAWVWFGYQGPYRGVIEQMKGDKRAQHVMIEKEFNL